MYLRIAKHITDHSLIIRQHKVTNRYQFCQIISGTLLIVQANLRFDY
jgi:hypothetical protein